MQPLHAATVRNDGHALERAIGNFLAGNGYDVQLNVVRPGRSGAAHEIDVLATSPGSFASVEMAVECKAWQQPVEKDVVFKLEQVMRDCGIHKGIVVSSGGFRSGADLAAQELSIELWGPVELAHFLGPAAMSTLARPAVPVRHACGWAFATTVDGAERAVRAEARGNSLLGRKEKVHGIQPAWVPMHLAWISVAAPKRQRSRMTTVSVDCANRYDGLTAGLAGAAPSPPTTIDLGQVAVIPQQVRSSKLAASLTKAVDAAMKVTTDAATARHSTNLARLGIPWPCLGISVERIDDTWWPTWVALLEDRGVQRLVAVDGVSGRVDPVLSTVLTAKIGHVRSVLG